MANNRLYLTMPDGQKMLLAKYYPSTGWFPYGGTDDRLAKFLENVPKGTLWGNFSVALEFEQEQD